MRRKTPANRGRAPKTKLSPALSTQASRSPSSPLSTSARALRSRRALPSLARSSRPPTCVDTRLHRIRLRTPPRRTESGSRRAAPGNNHQRLVVCGIGAGFESLYVREYLVAERCAIRDASAAHFKQRLEALPPIKRTAGIHGFGDTVRHQQQDISG